MLCLIADIKTYVPAVGGMVSRCREYQIEGEAHEAELVLNDALYRYELWPGMNENDVAYMESGAQFYVKLLNFDGLMLHASATIIDGEAFLFAGQCGIGKSTHANLLKKLFPNSQLINDDKPALRRLDGKWFAYGTPWSGKNGININTKSPLKAICLLTTRRDRNNIQVADPLRAAAGLISCSTGRGTRERILKLAPLIDHLMKEIPIYEMDSLADDTAARMAYNTMKMG